uniref:Uncharacterized protein ycf53 n=1 Tax=Cyanidium caldarium TaxID=2771 RepID=YCF53_CYACA|nr:hypothetical protein JXY51_pgp162 [Cyanidium caldarium]O19887.1 RecName: Full=Uncharacterized protein ycf53 [Cyanidium caldarium]AAB82702.1 unknown [Cyanidium caldarium]WDB00186.1 hypothetical protein CDCA019_064 [Cyanidium caldarium]
MNRIRFISLILNLDSCDSNIQEYSRLAYVHDLNKLMDENFVSLLLIILKLAKNSKRLQPTYHNVYLFNLLKSYALSEIDGYVLGHFSRGFVNTLMHYKNAQYETLESLLSANNFFEANKFTQQILLELAGEQSKQRNWMYFTDVHSINHQSVSDLNHLWELYSQGNFGFSIQKRIWISVNKNWKKFWKKIGWINSNSKWLKYPGEFMWAVNAPPGHLPLFNQLRGVYVLEFIFDYYL